MEAVPAFIAQLRADIEGKVESETQKAKDLQGTSQGRVLPVRMTSECALLAQSFPTRQDASITCLTALIAKEQVGSPMSSEYRRRGEPGLRGDA